MKRLMTILAIIVLLLPTMAIAKQVTVNFTWDPNTEPDAAGYAIFQRVEGQAYDYNAPMDPDCTVVAGECWTDPATPANLFSHTFEVPDGALTTYYWVARARDTYANWSEDSNEVTYTFNLTALPPIADLAAVYNKTTQTVDFTWSHSDTRIVSYRLYQGSAAGGPYSIEVDHITNLSGVPITSSYSITPPAPGTVITYYFVVVGYDIDNNFTVNSNEVTVKIDRKPPTKVIQLKVTIQ